MTNRKPTATSRLRQDYLRLKRDPVPYITAEPLPSNILEWHYVVKGPEDSPYYGGYYHGTLLFPREFPFKPPSIMMLTPNGRFKTNTRLCLSISDFHPDTWNPAWSVATILTGLLSFMLENTPTLGSMETTAYEKKQLAKKSLAFNLKNSHFRDLFPDICEEINSRQQQTHQNGNAYGDPSSNGDLLANGGVGFADDKNTPMQHNSNNDSNWQSICSNLIVVISFAIFALIVNYIIKSLNYD
ncbi:unnamed protein product [Hermetia illucens]|uniref:Ubiquitin-conjugating enzyme E2 J2 n=1 Tax=Hermetia illucens TaxID=343691 RepID=A0A7R8V871_HERIL|nr:ubiquitin-conjugating enzyme E2 J2 [Hermetia illucens]XP_037925760.1 ubiquitin-conjugating enzyme E2 J2 [Hermetia illucens]CAD7093937.1 unnamed protein product [Hermetia illucens]